MKPSKDMWLLIGMFLLLVIGGLFMTVPDSHQWSTVSSSYNPCPKGVKAFYTLLSQKLGYRTDRLVQPYNEIPGNARVLIVVQPLRKYEIDFAETRALKKWVNRGGIAIFLSDSLSGVPAAFGSTQRIGEGAVYSFNSRRLVTNEGVRNYRNAMKVLSILSASADKSDLILFDEYHHGMVETETKSFIDTMSSQTKIALGILFISGLVLCYSRGRRFGAVRALPETDKSRPGFEFVESVARLYSRAHAASAAADILCGSFRHSLCPKLGLPVDASRGEIVQRTREDVTDEYANKVDSLLATCERAKAGNQLSEQELVNITKDIIRLEKELNLARVDA